MINKTGGIYQIVNTTNGNTYIGSAISFRQRRYEHWSMLHRGCHHSEHLQRAWNKYGEGAFRFDPLIICDPDMLIYYEQQFLDRWHSEYNACPTAGSSFGRAVSEETKAKIAKSLTGLKHTEDTKAKMSKAGKGRKRSAETLARLSRSLLGNTNGIGNKSHLGKHHTEETKIKISRANSGKKMTEEAKLKISLAMKKRWKIRRMEQESNV